jgi:hypothetical protein
MKPEAEAFLEAILVVARASRVPEVRALGELAARALGTERGARARREARGEQRR